MAGVYLTFGQRRKIEQLRAESKTPSGIAAAVGVMVPTNYRELHRGETGELDEHFRPAYSAEVVEKAFQIPMRSRGRRKSTPDRPNLKQTTLPAQPLSAAPGESSCALY